MGSVLGVADTLGVGVLRLGFGNADADAEAEGGTEADGDGEGLADGRFVAFGLRGAGDDGTLCGVAVEPGITWVVAAHAPLVLRDPYPTAKALMSTSTVKVATTKYLARPTTMRPPCLDLWYIKRSTHKRARPACIQFTWHRQ